MPTLVLSPFLPKQLLTPCSVQPYVNQSHVLIGCLSCYLRDESRFFFYRYWLFLALQKASLPSRHLSCPIVASLHELSQPWFTYFSHIGITANKDDLKECDSSNDCPIYIHSLTHGLPSRSDTVQSSPLLAFRSSSLCSIRPSPNIKPLGGGLPSSRRRQDRRAKLSQIPKSVPDLASQTRSQTRDTQLLHQLLIERSGTE